MDIGIIDLDEEEDDFSPGKRKNPIEIQDDTDYVPPSRVLKNLTSKKRKRENESKGKSIHPERPKSAPIGKRNNFPRSSKESSTRDERRRKKKKYDVEKLSKFLIMDDFKKEDSKQHCYTCGGAHNARDCSNYCCSECGSIGKCNSRRCFSRSKKCDWCRKKGHIKRDCPMREMNLFETGSKNEIRDYRLEQFFSRQSKKPKASYCFNCGRTDHTWDRCRQANVSYLLKILGSRAFRRSNR